MSKKEYEMHMHPMQRRQQFKPKSPSKRYFIVVVSEFLKKSQKNLF